MNSSLGRPWISTSLIENFSRARDSSEIERLADDLGEAGDPAAIKVLLSRLGDNKIQSDQDVEDAVCGALVRLRVMRKVGNLRYFLLGEDVLPDEAKIALKEYAQLIPQKYVAHLHPGE
jgi:hypothetical protein